MAIATTAPPASVRAAAPVYTGNPAVAVEVDVPVEVVLALATWAKFAQVNRVTLLEWMTMDLSPK